MRPRFQADADFNHKIVVGLRRREPSVDFLDARRSSPGLIIVAQHLDIGAAIEDLLLIWAATDATEWIGHFGFVPV